MLHVLGHCGFGAIRCRFNVAMAQVTGDAMEEGKLLKVEEIYAEGNPDVVLQNVSRQSYRLERWDVGSLETFRMTALDVGDVGAVDDVGATYIFDGDRAILDVAVLEAVLEYVLGGPTEFTIESPGTIRSLKLPTGEQLFLSGYRL